MSIPYWREVRYTDDGCRIYECLFCYKRWESRTSPHYVAYGEREDPTRGIWCFCPYCGVRWQGELPHSREDDIPRKFRDICYYGKRKAIWVIERTSDRKITPEEQSEYSMQIYLTQIVERFPAGTPVKNVLERLKKLRQEEEDKKEEEKRLEEAEEWSKEERIEIEKYSNEYNFSFRAVLLPSALSLLSNQNEY